MIRVTQQNYSTLIVETPILIQKQNLIVGNLEKLHEHHTELETHRYQMSLSTLSSFKELYQLMARQYDVPDGLYNGKSYKKILFWNWSGTMPVGRENSNFGVGVGRDRFKKAGCPVWQCETSENRDNPLQYDAMWMEPLDELNVRLHPSPEVYQQELAKFSQNNKVNYAAGKTKLAVSFASNCESKSNREEMTDLLIKHGIKTDICGACGNLTCGEPSIYSRPQDVEEECLQRITPNYKFFLAFHNSMCQDYTPER